MNHLAQHCIGSRGGLGQLSDDEIKRAITQGVARDGRKPKPPMAYAGYATMTAEDLDAIVAFVRTLPPRDQGVTRR
ncbi:cytochrome c [Bradyrhizobium manausense]|uniref:cytochrome c n=1 Tax=Bradyrhizobium manausense TaxID=989370 RepID=UPI002011970D|nr:cytochrome c [Bradyrhizobium manausense]